ncbi:hypothetical protein ACGF4C_35060 [Streptomyces sp. NPDC048197]|uniref:hypothetical protein n=1 Tax=Streptomyces sp. NPDC048197 TaxID=3365511 RepID=UPI00371D9CD6
MTRWGRIRGRPDPRRGGARGPFPVREDTTLKQKQRVRQLTADISTLDEWLKAARSNLRFQDAA